MERPRIAIRPAELAELPALYDLAERSVMGLLGSHYSATQLEAGRAAHLYEIETELVADGTYYVLDVDGRLVGGSGWSASGRFHPPGSTGSFGHAVESGTATMRATYVDPAWTRRGFASLLAQVTETAATIAGFRRFEALCTPMSEAVRLRLGYHVHERVKVPIRGDVHWDAAVMRKELDPRR
jgi:GNAT superfamily N-acetyltransferase